MMTPEISHVPHEAQQIEREQQNRGYEKIDLSAEELLAFIDESQVDVPAGDQKAIRSGKILAAYEHKASGRRSVLVAVGEKISVIVLKDYRMSEDQLYSGVEVIRKGDVTPGVSRSGFEKFNPEAVGIRNQKIAELNARINDLSTPEEDRKVLRAKRDAIGTGKSVVDGGMSEAQQEQLFAKILNEFQKARGDELAPEVRKVLDAVRRKQ